MQYIFDELEGDEEMLVVASRIADEAGITRSVIVNALRKLSSANVIESRSLGDEGNLPRILNRRLRAELERQRYPYPSGARDDQEAGIKNTRGPGLKPGLYSSTSQTRAGPMTVLPHFHSAHQPKFYRWREKKQPEPSM